MSKTFEGKPCRKCKGTTRYNNKYKQCVACKQAANKKSNDKRTKEQRQKEYQTSEIGLLYSDRFQVDAVRRAGTTETLVNSKEQMLVRLFLTVLRHKKLNGVGQSKAQWTPDHIYPQVGEIIEGKQRVGLTTLKNLRIISVTENKAKSNKIIGLGEYVEVELGSINRDLKITDDIRNAIIDEINYDSKNNYPLDVHHPITDEDRKMDSVLEEVNVNEIMTAYENGFYETETGERFELVAYDPATHRYEGGGYRWYQDEDGKNKLVRDENGKPIYFDPELVQYNFKTKPKDRTTMAAWTKEEVEDFQNKINELLDGQDLDEVEKALLAMLD